jgi:hypothetical protein
VSTVKPEKAMRSEGQRRLCAVLASLSLSQVALAAGCSSKQSVANWKAGTKVPDQHFREALEARYGIQSQSWAQEPGSADGGQGRPPEPVAAPSAKPSTMADVDALIAFLRTELESPTILARERVKLSGSMTSALALRHRLEREQELSEDRIVREHPAWKRVHAAILDAVRPYPEAARAVAKALTEVGM